MVANHVLCQLSYTPDKRLRNADFGLRVFSIRILHSAIRIPEGWLRGRDLNPRPLGYEPNELPDCSTPRQARLRITEFGTRFFRWHSTFPSPNSAPGLMIAI
jgi:hypothetical protein